MTLIACCSQKSWQHYLPPVTLNHTFSAAPVLVQAWDVLDKWADWGQTSFLNLVLALWLMVVTGDGSFCVSVGSRASGEQWWGLAGGKRTTAEADWLELALKLCMGSWCEVVFHSLSPVISHQLKLVSSNTSKETTPTLCFTHCLPGRLD